MTVKEFCPQVGSTIAYHTHAVMVVEQKGTQICITPLLLPVPLIPKVQRPTA